MHPNIWHPFTIQKGASDPLKVLYGEGIWLELEGGRRIADCISSWWVNLHGHSHPEMVKAIHEQALKLEHVLFANFTHDPAEQLAEKLVQILPGELNRVFYSDNGSTSVEVALKMAIQYWQNLGDEKTGFIAFEGAYHGDTFGAMSAGARSVFNNVFEGLLFDVDFVPYPFTWNGDHTAAEKEAGSLLEIQKLLNDNRGKYAAILIEPLVQGAGGMRMCREEFMRELKKICSSHNVLLILDEVMTGFGRTGGRFAAEKAGTEPDIICLAKGLTGGFLPLSVTACSGRIYESFYSEDPGKALWHGHSYTANPLGCAAALASLRLLEDNAQAWQKMESKHTRFSQKLQEHPLVEKVRISGTIMAFDLKTAGTAGYLNPLSGIIKKQCTDYGLLVRPLGNTLYLMPPYCITDSELEWVYEKLFELIQSVTG